MEALFAIMIVCLAALGLGFGLIVGRQPPRMGCDGVACVGGTRCDGCPHGGKRDHP